MALSSSRQALQGTFSGSQFPCQTNLPSLPHKSLPTITKISRFRLTQSAKFDLFELMGGRGICNGEQGLLQELQRNVEEQVNGKEAATENMRVSATDDNVSEGAFEKELMGLTGGFPGGEKGLQRELRRNVGEQVNGKEACTENMGVSATERVPENAFEKELMGLTGGFPGGEKGLEKFLEENPPPKDHQGNPELALLLPGMIALVKNPCSPYYMYWMVERITDGKPGVLFEGGHWDRLIKFGLEELEAREKGPLGKIPQVCFSRKQLKLM
ncbi:hypothetical protein K2173_010265 [Erythroxylum novogranatense]|uniref:Chlororespiratory reduction31 n=1 Tax=Erythroxylum novogranatense TaxID=1862640 RepID=A0AAV8TDF1_9ROSI|nr:hypothetical protein K2173_010265 [Erythroxylum novogranatense]